MQHHTLISLLLLIITSPAIHSQCHDVDSITAALTQHPLDPIEGIWQFTPDQATVAISATAVGQYDIIILDSPDPSITPGLTMGTATLTARHNTYDTTLATKYNGETSTLTHKRHFTITLSDDNTSLTLSQYNTGASLNLWRCIPYMFRYTISRRNTRPSGLDGCHRIYPTSSPLNPSYL